MKNYKEQNLIKLSSTIHRNKSHSLKKNRGYTLFEVLIALSIAGILGLQVAPSMHDLTAKERRVSSINRMLSIIRYTRAQALTKQNVITLCPTKDEHFCLGDWNQPLMVFIDLNRDRKRQQNEPVLKKLPAIAKQDSLKWKAFRYSNVLQFLPSGITNHQNGTFLYCPDKTRSDLSRGIIMTKMGRTRLSVDRNHDGFQEGAGGRALSCS